jgi:beta-galactosidase
MKFGATLPPCDVKTRDAFAAMDVAGYNYGIRRYEHDLKKYPHRLILGSETFCSDAYRFWELAKGQPRILGDFVWSGMDYLGEVGVGAREYPAYAPYPNSHVGWVSAGSGRIDLTGKPLAEMSYTQVAFEQKKIAIGVLPVKYAGERHSPSAWKMTAAIESWSWNGCEGKKATVEVYARAHHIALFVNGVCVGTKRPKENCLVTFQTPYHDGEVKAVAYDDQDRILAEKTMKTAGAETVLSLRPEQTEVRREGELCYIRLCLTDAQGEIKPLERTKITLTVEGGQLLGCGSACPVYELSYLGNVTDTYYGEALAIIRPGSAQQITLRAESELGSASVTVPVR